MVVGIQLATIHHVKHAYEHVNTLRFGSSLGSIHRPTLHIAQLDIGPGCIYQALVCTDTHLYAIRTSREDIQLALPTERAIGDDPIDRVQLDVAIYTVGISQQAEIARSTRQSECRGLATPSIEDGRSKFQLQPKVIGHIKDASVNLNAQCHGSCLLS